MSFLLAIAIVAGGGLAGFGGVAAAEANADTNVEPDDICVGGGEDPLGQPQGSFCVSIGGVGGITESFETADEVCAGGGEGPFGQPKAPICVELADV